MLRLLVLQMRPVLLCLSATSSRSTLMLLLMSVRRRAIRHHTPCRRRRRRRRRRVIHVCVVRTRSGNGPAARQVGRDTRVADDLALEVVVDERGARGSIVCCWNRRGRMVGMLLLLVLCVVWIVRSVVWVVVLMVVAVVLNRCRRSRRSRGDSRLVLLLLCSSGLGIYSWRRRQFQHGRRLVWICKRVAGREHHRIDPI